MQKSIGPHLFENISILLQDFNCLMIALFQQDK